MRIASGRHIEVILTHRLNAEIPTDVAEGQLTLKRFLQSPNAYQPILRIFGAEKCFNQSELPCTWN